MDVGSGEFSRSWSRLAHADLELSPVSWPVTFPQGSGAARPSPPLPLLLPSSTLFLNALHGRAVTPTYNVCGGVVQRGGPQLFLGGWGRGKERVRSRWGERQRGRDHLGPRSLLEKS